MESLVPVFCFVGMLANGDKNFGITLTKAEQFFQAIDYNSRINQG